ncbi:DUF4863 family protein [Roseomonas sp. BN140053]|uniref:4-hydroxylaminobenzoate lyase n=1 Tax=Roseomonas sp. BN140053 TaxID=3391898 RepID=UPI0039E79261
MSLAAFEQAVVAVTGRIAGRPVSPALGAAMNAEFPPDGPEFTRLAALCRQGIAEGWLCNREAGGIRYGRAIKATPATHGFSVDVVVMDSIAGPQHAHPGGEIDMILPETPGAAFDGVGEGWLVYGPGSEHAPTVTGGRAVVLYLLPEGAIEFKKRG